MKFSRKTSQPRKVRKRFYNVALHARQALVASHLSKDLRLKLKKRSIGLRKGDKVRVLRGKFKKKEGRVVRVDLKRCASFVEGCVLRKQAGKEVLAPIHPSNLLVFELVERKLRKVS